MHSATYIRLADAAFAPSAIPSPLDGVSSEKWTAFVRAMLTAPLSAVSASNALGLFEMMPRRLGDLGLVTGLARTRSPRSKRTIWTGRFVAPLTSDHFLKSPEVQYRVFEQSIVDYATRIADGEIEKDAEMTLSGALAILHRCGPRGLQTWAKGERFPATVRAYERAAGIF